MSTLDDKILFLESILQQMKNVLPEDYDSFKDAFLKTCGDDYCEAVRLTMREAISVRIDPETNEEILDPVYPEDYDISPADAFYCTQDMLIALSTSFLQTLLLYRWSNKLD